MTPIAKEQMDEFLNALQLSVNAVIDKAIIDAANHIGIKFLDDARQDKNCQFFARIVDGEWSLDGHSLHFGIKNADELKKLWGLLMMTRLSVENMKSMASSDPEFAWLNHYLDPTESNRDLVLSEIPKISKTLFEILVQKKWSVRNLSERTGISQVSLFRFKQGKDIRLSNFIEIANALDLNIILKPRKPRFP